MKFNEKEQQLIDELINGLTLKRLQEMKNELIEKIGKDVIETLQAVKRDYPEEYNTEEIINHLIVSMNKTNDQSWDFIKE